jgi:hypothetical protein
LLGRCSDASRIFHTARRAGADNVATDRIDALVGFTVRGGLRDIVDYELNSHLEIL